MSIRPFAFVLLLGLGACATDPAPRAAGKPAPVTEFLAFGDHGYSLDYLDAEDLTPPKTEADYIAAARAKWLKEKRPAAEFTPGPISIVQGSAVAASGMMPVARAMDGWCRAHRCQFGVMLGDNIYPDGPTLGADGRDDARRFQDIFMAPYGKFGWGDPDFRIYAVLGNHDWHTSRAAALSEVKFLSATRPFYMDGISYAAVPKAAAGEVEIFAIDSHVLLAGEKVLEDKLADDGSEVATTKFETSEPWTVPATPAEKAMAADLEARLKASKARWKIVIAHHPLWASAGGKFRQSEALRRAILPIVCRYADLYFAGHEHTLEVATDDCRTVTAGTTQPPLPHIVTGSAGKQRPLNTAFMAHQARNNPQYASLYARGMVWGFSHVRLQGDTATVTMIATPNDGSGATDVVFTQDFQRRSGFTR
ncbi:MAG: hypothetical protein CFE37_00395 [Alphaproteobacteria bacterium PA4]|nr:MAG: hypothetical protein CFE37_00395 [Alphaproteobacteria bacterium PA4]